MPFDEIFPPQLQASNGQQNNCHRQCKCMGEPLLLDVLTLWGQNYFEAIPIYNQGKSLLSKRKSSIGKGSSLAINIFDIKAPSELLLLITQAIWLNWLYQLALTSEMAFRIQK